MRDYYYILGIKQDASAIDIKKAYRKLSLKFHPDKNNGDEFFSDRFKEIQEAYETLSNSTKRAKYNDNYPFENDNSKSTKGYNFDPVIEYFKANKASFAFDEGITFSWKTINSDRVKIKPFGFVEPIDQKTYKIKDFKNPVLSFELIAENSNTGRFIKQTIKLKSRTYQELYSHFKKVIAAENNTSEQKSYHTKQKTNSSKPIGEFKTDKGFIKVELNFERASPSMNNKVYQNGRLAKDGKYKLGFMDYIVIKNGLIVNLTAF